MKACAISRHYDNGKSIRRGKDTRTGRGDASRIFKMLSEHCAKCDEYSYFSLTNGVCRKCLKRVSPEVANRYLRRFGGTVSGWQDGPRRLNNKHGKIVAIVADSHTQETR